MATEQGEGTGPRWILDGYVARGAITLFAGAAKTGKSTWLMGLLRALRVGDSFCGRNADSTSVIYLIEEEPTTLLQRAGAFGLALGHVRWLTAEHALQLGSWQASIASALAEAASVGAGLLVIDSFAHWANLDAEQENDAAVVTGLLRDLRRATGNGLAVLVVHHLGGGGRPRGSTAFEAEVDIVCEFKPRGGKDSTQRQLAVKSRFPGTSCERVIELDLDTYTYRALEEPGPVGGSPEGPSQPRAPNRRRAPKRARRSGEEQRLVAVSPGSEAEAAKEAEVRDRYKRRWGEPLSRRQFGYLRDALIKIEGYPARYWVAR
jgi:hypothetical protein